MTKNFILLIFILSAFTAFSQKMKISGTVYDSSGVQPIEDAIAMTVRMKDSVILEYTRTDKEGKFSLQRTPIDTFTLIISHIRYDDKNYYVFGSQENSEIDIPVIRMEVKAKEIQEVTIYANKNPIYFRGDTLVYVADSFKVGPNAVVEDLLKKLPGISVDKNGAIKAQGKEINKVYVDGDEFFGTDPTIATKNLGADGIETVEVYETKNENQAEGEDETIQVMNLKLKEEAKKGYFGRVSGASDFTQFYEGELLFNKFDNYQKISVFMLGSNTPRSNLDWSDINKFGLDNEDSFSENDDGDWISNGNYNWNDGIPQTLRGGIYYKNKIGKKKNTDIGFNYSINDYKVNSISRSFSQYFLSDTSYYTNDSTQSITKNTNHSFNLSLKSDLDSMTTIEFKPSFIYTLGESEQTDYSEFLTSNSERSRINNIQKNNSSTVSKFSSKTSFTREFKKDRRQIEFDHDMNLKDNRTVGNLFYENLYYLSSIPSDTTDQRKINDNISNTQNAALTYTEPIKKKSKIETEYMFDYNHNVQSKESRNKIDGEYIDLDSTYSNKFKNDRLTNRLSVIYQYESRLHSFSAGARVRNVQIENTNLISGMIVNQNVSNILPRLSYTYKPSQSKRLTFRYNTNSSLPSINALQPIQDNSNPNKVPIGNPNLKPSFNHSTRLQYNSWNAINDRFIWASGEFTYTNNAFADSTSFDTLGRLYSKTVNVDGNMRANLNMYTGTSLYKNIVKLNTNLSYFYNKNVNFIDGAKNYRYTNNYNGSLELNFTFDSLNFSMRYNYSLSNPNSTISSQTNKPYSSQEIWSGFEWTLPWWHFNIRAEATYYINSQRTSGYNINYLIVNAEINKNFLKTENLILSLQGNDILNQNIMAERSIGNNVITDYKTKVISRYVLLKLTYKFNNKKTKESDGWD